MNLLSACPRTIKMFSRAKDNEYNSAIITENGAYFTIFKNVKFKLSV